MTVLSFTESDDVLNVSDGSRNTYNLLGGDDQMRLGAASATIVNLVVKRRAEQK